MKVALPVSHHLLLSHGWAVPVIRQNSPDAQVGIVINVNRILPASPSQADFECKPPRGGNVGSLVPRPFVWSPLPG